MLLLPTLLCSIDCGKHSCDDKFVHGGDNVRCGGCRCRDASKVIFKSVCLSVMFEVARRKMLFKSSCIYVSLFEVLRECDRPSVLFLIGSHHCVCVCWKPETFCLLQYLTHHPPATKYALYYVNAQTLLSWKLNGKRYWHQENSRFTCHLWVKEYFPHLPPRYAHAQKVLRIQMCNKNTALSGSLRCWCSGTHLHCWRMILNQTCTWSVR